MAGFEVDPRHLMPPLLPPDNLGFSHKLYNTYHSFKYFYYPSRPIFTFLVGLLIAALAFVHFIPTSIALFVAVTLLTDDTLLYPIFSLLKHMMNFKGDYKTTKSIVGTLGIVLGYLIGGLIGWYLLPVCPVMMSIVTAVYVELGSNLTVIAICAVLGSIVSNFFGKGIVLGALIGAGVALLLPITLPLMVDIVALSVLLGGFAMALATKYGMALLYKCLYGHSNADGLYFAFEKSAQPLDVDRKRAQFFRIKASLFHRLRVAVLKAKEAISAKMHYGNELTGTAMQVSGSFHDILHLMMRANTDQDKAYLRDMLMAVHDVASQAHFYDTVGYFGLRGVRQEAAQQRQNDNGQQPLIHRRQIDDSIQRAEAIGENGWLRLSDRRRYHNHMLFFKQTLECGFSKCAQVPEAQDVAVTFRDNCEAFMTALTPHAA